MDTRDVNTSRPVTGGTNSKKVKQQLDRSTDLHQERLRNRGRNPPPRKHGWVLQDTMPEPSE
jgi:hypothetical protein